MLDLLCMAFYELFINGSIYFKYSHVCTSRQVSSSLQCSSTGLRLSRGESNNFSFQSVITESGVKEYDFLNLSQLPASVALDGGNIHFSSLLAKVQFLLHLSLPYLFDEISTSEPTATCPITTFVGLPQASLCV